jgi:hypothetical protein
LCEAQAQGSQGASGKSVEILTTHATKESEKIRLGGVCLGMAEKRATGRDDCIAGTDIFAKEGELKGLRHSCSAQGKGHRSEDYHDTFSHI